MMRNYKKGFTIIELITTLAISSILLVTLTAFLVFTLNISNDYRDRTNTLHSANNMAITIRNYIDSCNDGNLTIMPYVNPSDETPSKSTILKYDPSGTDNDYELFFVPYIASSNTNPKLLIKYNSDTTADTIFVAKSALKLNISNNTYISSNAFTFTIAYSDTASISFSKVIN